MTLYRRRPTVVECFKWQPDHHRQDDDKHPIPEWLVHHCTTNGDTLEIWGVGGITRAFPGDWVVQENGKIYPIKSETFEKLYEAMHD